MTEKIKSGRGLKKVGVLLLVIGTFGPVLVTCWPHSVLPQINNYILVLLVLVITLPMITVGLRLYWRGRQYAARAVAERVISDSKPDVLYLRAFGTDPSFWVSDWMSGWLTEEEQLREVLQPFGDVVAIGKPGETLPTPGAARLYASDAEWKKVVTGQMQTARLVVIRAGTSGGLLWELKEVVQVVNPKKLLILILKMRKKDYESFRKEADQIFNTTFPKIDELKPSWRRFWWGYGFVRFSPNWSTNFLPLRVPFFRFDYKPFCRLLKYTLRPVFEEYGLEWKPPPVSILMVLMVVYFGGIGVVILLAMLLFVSLNYS